MADRATPDTWRPELHLGSECSNCIVCVCVSPIPLGIAL